MMCYVSGYGLARLTIELLATNILHYNYLTRVIVQYHEESNDPGIAIYSSQL